MAIFYNITQVGKGTLGNTYLRRTRSATGKEVNVLAQKNFNPKNPKTLGQMAQRARFATAVKFFKRATRNFFKFAYEDKQANESDYNAFMRHNIAASVPMVKAQVDNESYPAIGNKWMLSQGSLLPLRQKMQRLAIFTESVHDTLVLADDDHYDLDEPYFESNATVGRISQILVKMGYSEGQIFTLVTVTSGIKQSQFQLLSPDGMEGLDTIPRWSISQFVINTKDETKADAVGHIGYNYLPAMYCRQAFGTDTAYFGVDYGANEGGLLIAAAAIVSENVKSSKKLLATTSYLEGNELYNAVVNDLNTKIYYNAMLVSWGADFNLAILQGSIAGTHIATKPVISGVNGTVPPVNGGMVTGGTDVTLKLTGSFFDSDEKLTKDSFKVEGCTIKSFTNTGTNAATLVITTTAGAGEYKVKYGSQILWSATAEKA